MNKILGRNDACHCGSGKKYKACHGLSSYKSSQQWIIAAVIILIILWFFFYEPEPEVTTPTINPLQNSLIPQSNNELSLPPGPAPPGKVWSPEHGHWHDGATVSPATTPRSVLNKPQTQPPPGEAPPGKEWSPEHGHWHDANTVLPATTPRSVLNKPQTQPPPGEVPPGEAPPGKEWSPEHNHWHNE